jgi:DNA-binding MarR family transcriptional regulator
MYPEEDRYAFTSKWSSEIGQFNFTQVPNILLACQGHLNITDGELLTLIHLQSFRFRADSVVFPSISTLAKFSHKHFTTVQKRLRVLEEKGFIERKHIQGTSNRYNLEPCIRKLEAHVNVCTNPPRKYTDHTYELSGLPSSYLSSKEDEQLNKEIKEKLIHIRKISRFLDNTPSVVRIDESGN